MHRRGVNSAIISTNVYHSQFAGSNSIQNNIISSESEEIAEIRSIGGDQRRSASFLLDDEERSSRAINSNGIGNIMPIDDMVFKNKEERIDQRYLNESLGWQQWEKVDQKGTEKPCPRSSSASVIYKESLYLFGGFTFCGRLEEIYEYNFRTQKWTKLKTKGSRPSARENNGAVIYDNKLYVYGGYDGVSWFKDFYALDFSTLEWTRLPVLGDAPSQSFGFASGRFETTFAIFGGFEGSSWLNDYFTYDFLTQKWKKVQLKGHVPSERSCPSYCVKDEYLYIFGGFNGIDKLHDFYRINIKKAKCTFIQQKGAIPSPRYFHSQIFYSDKIYLFGGYNGQIRLNDLYEFSLNTSTWLKIDQKEPPAGRSSMVLQIYQDSLFLYGGYNGSNVMSDFYKFRFQNAYLPQSQYVQDIYQLLDNDMLSDVQFQVENNIINGNKCILACRCEYFKLMFSTGLQESIQQQNLQPIVIKDVSYDTFMDVLKFIYTDSVDAMLSQQRISSLLQLADLYFLDRLKFLCEERLVTFLNQKNVIDLLLLSHQSKCTFLKNYALKYTLDNIKEIKQLPQFQKLMIEPALLMEIIMNKVGEDEPKKADR